MIDTGGGVRHIEPPEIHGDPLDDGGILAYYHFGWPILDELRDVGFGQVELGITYDPLCGFTGRSFRLWWGSVSGDSPPLGRFICEPIGGKPRPAYVSGHPLSRQGLA